MMKIEEKINDMKKMLEKKAARPEMKMKYEKLEICTNPPSDTSSPARSPRGDPSK